MKEFTERHHARIIAEFYTRLNEGYGAQGRELFAFATRRYAEQRGGRMAQRAIRDGRKLTFSTYREYGEWVNAKTTIENGDANKVNVEATSPDLIQRITKCPWATEFAAVGAQECGILYCAHVDKSLARGFNPELVYEVHSTLNDAEDCLHILRDVGDAPGERNPKNLKTFDYHCGHVYKTFSELTVAVLGDDKIPDGVLTAFGKAYGGEMAEVLVSYLDTDFNHIDDHDITNFANGDGCGCGGNCDGCNDCDGGCDC